MIKLNKILFPTDFSRCANQAFSRALSVARQYDAELHLLHGIILHEDNPHQVLHHIPNVEEVQSRLKDASVAEMESLVKSYSVNGLKVIRANERGIDTAQVILEYAEEHDVDLIAMGTHGRRGLGHLFLGSVAEEVVRLAHRPVLTMRERKNPKPFQELQRILVPVDFSEHSANALAYAKEIAATYGARLQLLHVVEKAVHPAFYVTGQSSIFDFVPDVKAKSEEAMEQLIEDTEGPDVEASLYVSEGRAAGDIADFAEKHDSDLIVISTHGLTGIQHFLVGSVTEKVIRLAPCPVFTVKSFGKCLVS